MVLKFVENLGWCMQQRRDGNSHESCIMRAWWCVGGSENAGNCLHCRDVGGIRLTIKGLCTD